MDRICARVARMDRQRRQFLRCCRMVPETSWPPDFHMIDLVFCNKEEENSHNQTIGAKSLETKFDKSTLYDAYYFPWIVINLVEYRACHCYLVKKFAYLTQQTVQQTHRLVRFAFATVHYRRSIYHETWKIPWPLHFYCDPIKMMSKIHHDPINLLILFSVDFLNPGKSTFYQCMVEFYRFQVDLNRKMHRRNVRPTKMMRM